MRTPLEYIEHLRTKPVAHRKRVALIATFLMGGSILVTWGTYESKKLAIVEPGLEQAPAPESQVASPFQAFVHIFK